MTHHLDVVFLDVGGTLYDDVWYYRALLGAIRSLGGDVTDHDFRDEYDRWRANPGGSFRQLMARRFLGDDVDLAAVGQAMAERWHYPAEALMPQVRGCLEQLHGRYRLGIIADQESTIRDALRRDGIERSFDVWCISADVGMEKPDPRLFSLALTTAEVEPERAAMVGDRLDDDVRPAKELGMRTVWVLTGKAPPRPTPEQLAEPDVAIATLAELPDALEALAES